MTHLLIVDDEPYIVNWLSKIFTKIKTEQFAVYKAFSASQALEQLEQGIIDIILSDISMPEMDGLQLMHVVKESWPHCEIIFLTAYENFDYVYRAINKNCAGYLLKTEDDDKIIATVCDVSQRLQEKRKLDSPLERSQQSLPQPTPNENDLEKEHYIIHWMKQFVQEHLAGNLSLALLAEELYYHPSYLSRLFKEEIGMNYTSFVTFSRIERAKELLEQGNKPIQDIAIEVGFESSQYFSRVFRQKTGKTPQKYRENNYENSNLS